MHLNFYRFELASPFLGVADVVMRIKTVQQDSGIDTRHLGLIPQRLPSLNYRASEFVDKGYAVTDIDALTGAQRFHNIRFDDSGQVFNLDPNSITPELRAMLTLTGAPNFPQLNAYMLNSALDRQAIAPLWEVKTARMQNGQQKTVISAAQLPNKALTIARPFTPKIISVRVRDTRSKARFDSIVKPVSNDRVWEAAA